MLQGKMARHAVFILRALPNKQGSLQQLSEWETVEVMRKVIIMLLLHWLFLNHF